MIPPPDEAMRALAALAQQHPALLEWLRSWRTAELDRLPSALVNPALFQGRCQVLGEFVKLVESAPAVVAKSK